MSMNPIQCRMARAGLGISIAELAKAAGVRAATISHFESGGDSYRSTVDKLRDALQDRGAVFFPSGDGVPSGGAGVRLKD